MSSAWKSGNVRKIGFFAMVWLLWAACPSEAGAITVAIPTNTSILSVSSNEGTDQCAYGEAATIAVEVTPFAGPAAGSVSLSVTSGANVSHAQLTISNLATDHGFANLTANYPGNTNPAFGASTSQLFVETVIPASTTTSVSSGTNPSVAGQAVTYTATVKPEYSGTPTGAVSFFEDGVDVYDANLIDGTASITGEYLVPTSRSLKAQYNGDPNFARSVSRVLTQTVNAASLKSTQTTLTSSLDPALIGQPVNLTAAVSGSGGTPTGTVPAQGSAYYEAGNPQASLASGSAQITADPSIVVQALFRDDSNGTYYEAAVPSSSGSEEFLFPFDATTFAGNGQPFYTGFAIANLSESPADLICAARDQNGVVIPDAVPVPELSSFGHWANYLFPALTGMRGTIDCVASTSVAATALRFIGNSAFSSLPVITK